jgi:hypothetical protein
MSKTYKHFTLKYVSRRRRTIPGPDEEPGVNEVSFRARPHYNVHRTLGVDAGATDPL